MPGENEKPNRLNFTEAAIKGLPSPAKGARVLYYDLGIRGLVVRVSQETKVFYLYRKVNGSPVMQKLGAHPELTVKDARLKVQERNLAIQSDGDLGQFKRRTEKEQTFGELFAWYLRVHSSVRKKTTSEDERQFNSYLGSVAGRRVSDITRAEIRELHADIGTKHGLYAANRTLAMLRTVYNKATAHEIFMGPNPAKGVEMHREKTRERWLMGDEIPKFLEALENEQNGAIRDYIWLSLLTGARQANVLEMRWEQIDFKGRLWKIPETKNGTSQVVPIQAPELAILEARRAGSESPWVFPSKGRSGHLVEPKSGWKRIIDSAGLTDLRLHDLRRTFGSWMANSRTAENVIGKALGHKSQAATAIYARLALDPIREAKDRAFQAFLGTTELSVRQQRTLKGVKQIKAKLGHVDHRPCDESKTLMASVIPPARNSAPGPRPATKPASASIPQPPRR